MKKKIGKLVKNKVEFSETEFFVSKYLEISFLTTLMLHVTDIYNVSHFMKLDIDTKKCVIVNQIQCL